MSMSTWKVFVAVTVLAETEIDRKHGINFFVNLCWVSVLLLQETYPVFAVKQNPQTFLFPAKKSVCSWALIKLLRFYETIFSFFLILLIHSTNPSKKQVFKKMNPLWSVSAVTLTGFPSFNGTINSVLLQKALLT